MTVSAQQLQDWVEDARARTFAMVDDLDDDRMTAPPYLPLLDEADAHGMLSCGFSIDASVRIQGEDRAGVERLSICI